MKFRYFIILISIYLFFSENKLLAQDITTTLGVSRDKSELLFGFNRRSDKGSWYTDDSFINCVSEMSPDVIRYPGGTQANYWDWRYGKFIPNSGKEWYEKEVVTIETFINAIPNETKIVYVVNMARPTPSTGVDVNASDNIIKSDATLYLMVDDMIDALKEFELQGRLPFAVELGNEFYFGNEEGGMFYIGEVIDNDDKVEKTKENAKFYLDHCKVIVEEIKLEFPNIKFILTTTKGGYASRDAWNNTIFEELEGNSFYSNLKEDIFAITQHHYINDDYPIKDQEVIPIYDTKTSEIAIAEGVSYTRESQIDYEIVPDKYDLWLTEYGVVKKNAEYTWTTGLRSLAMTLTWLDLGDKIGQLDYHFITSENVVTPVNGSYKLAPIGIASSLLSMASKNMLEMNRISFNNNPYCVDDIESLHGYKFKSNEKETLIIINISSKDLLSINIEGLLSYSSTPKITQYWSEQPYITDVYQGHSNILSENDNIEGGTFNSPKFSITVIESLNDDLGLDDKLKSNLEVYPNPFADEIIIGNYIGTINDIQVYNMSGKNVTHLIRIKQNSDNVLIKTLHLPKGYYLLKTNKGSGIISKE